MRKRLALPPRVPTRPASVQAAATPSNAEILARRSCSGNASSQLLLCDFDNTLTDFDAGGVYHLASLIVRLLGLECALRSAEL